MVAGFGLRLLRGGGRNFGCPAHPGAEDVCRGAAVLPAGNLFLCAGRCHHAVWRAVQAPGGFCQQSGGAYQRRSFPGMCDRVYIFCSHIRVGGGHHGSHRRDHVSGTEAPGIPGGLCSSPPGSGRSSGSHHTAQCAVHPVRERGQRLAG